ncbi:hypothetical protein X759_26890 [Mesorhizobium sp. LSHC420B00]|nr:hypothetical protein X759_26890 [Mesorhizobium sp. LSHC420B00]
MKAAGKIGLEGGNNLFVDALIVARTSCKTGKLEGIALMGDDESAGPRHQRGQRPFPPVGCNVAESDDRLLGAFAFAPSGEHAAGEPGGIAADLAANFSNRDGCTRRGQFMGNGEACHTRAFDKNAAHGSARPLIFLR